MLVFRSSSAVMLAFLCEAATTGRVPGPNMPPIKALMAITRGANRRERRGDDNTDLQDYVYSIGRFARRSVPVQTTARKRRAERSSLRFGFLGISSRRFT